MRGLSMQRAWGVAGAIVVAVAGTAYSTVPASGAPRTVTCTSLSGNLSSTPVIFTVGGCSGNTGGSGSAEGNTITWHDGMSTFLTSTAFTPSHEQRARRCGALSNKWTIADSVASDLTGSIKAGGKVSAKVCILNEAPDPWSLAPGSVLTLR